MRKKKIMQEVHKWEFVRKEEGFSLEKANRSISKIVIADGGLNGAYIGKLEKVKFEDDMWWGVVNIHGVSRYPVQDINYEMAEWEGRVPFQHAGVFLIDYIKEYSGNDQLYGFYHMDTREQAFHKMYSVLNKYAHSRKLTYDEKKWLDTLYINPYGRFDKKDALKALNILRLHAKLFEYKLPFRKMVLDRKPWTDWVVTVNEPSNTPYYDAFYRTSMRDGRECELFTLVANDSDDALLQLYIFPDEVNHVTWVPAIIRTNHEKKRIYIDLLVHIEHNDNYESISITLKELNTIKNRIIG